MIFGSAALPRSTRISFRALDDWDHDPLAHTVLVARSTGLGPEHELIDAGGFALGPPRVQLLNEVEAQIDFADTGGCLGLLDDESLMGRVDGAPAQRTDLPDAQTGLGHEGNHWPPADAPIRARGAIEVAGDGEKLRELVGLEKPTGGPIRP